MGDDGEFAFHFLFQSPSCEVFEEGVRDEEFIGASVLCHSVYWTGVVDDYGDWYGGHQFLL